MKTRLDLFVIERGSVITALPEDKTLGLLLPTPLQITSYGVHVSK
jgi:hypothetical protein